VTEEVGLDVVRVNDPLRLAVCEEKFYYYESSRDKGGGYKRCTVVVYCLLGHFDDGALAFCANLLGPLEGK